MIKLNGKYPITKIAVFIMMLVAGIASRLIPHPANFTPVAAIAIFGGSYFDRKTALATPLLIMFISDLFLGFGNLPVHASIYLSLIVSVLIGLYIKKRKNIKTILSGTILSSVIFFLVTNFAVWAFTGMYAKSIIGLSECYVLAIPFFRNTLLGDMFYVGSFFGGYELISTLVPSVWPQKA